MKNKNNNETIQESRTATILFVDLVRSSELASTQPSEKYVNDYVLKFQKRVLDIFKFKKRGGVGVPSIRNINDDFIDYSVRGDEGFFIIASKQENNISEQRVIEKNRKIIEKDILTVLRIALRIKYEWLFEDKNIKQLEKMKQPFEVAIGINTGKVIITKSIGTKKRFNAEGYAINLAKRIEGESRRGDSSGIYVSEHTFGFYNGISGENTLRFKQRKKSELRGISGFVRVYELVFANLDEEDEILKIPTEWIKIADEKRDELKKIEKYFNDTLNPWIGNVLVNIKWRKAATILDSILLYHIRKEYHKENYEEIEKLLYKSIEIARKLIEIDPTTAVWKIYLAQIMFDYLYYKVLNHNKNILDTNEYRQLVIKDTAELLQTLTTSEPQELDGRLYLGRYYLELKYNENASFRNTFSNSKVTNSNINYLYKAIEQFQRIIIWDDKYPDAYLYLSGAIIQINFIRFKCNKINLDKYSEENERAFLILEKGIRYSGDKYGEKMKGHVKSDKLFKPVWGIKRFKEIVESKTKF